MPNMSEKTMYIYASIIVAFIILMIFLGVLYKKSRRIEKFSNTTTKSPETAKKDESNPNIKPSFLSKKPSPHPVYKPLPGQGDKPSPRPIDKPSLPKQPSQNIDKCSYQTLKDSLKLSQQNNDKLKKHLQEMITTIDKDSKKISENIQSGLLKCNRSR